MPPKKKVAAIVKVQLQAGMANPAPPVGTALGPHGVNIMEFCKAYNSATEAMRGNVVPVEITIYEDRTFSFITKDQIREIATTKMPDLNATDIDAAMKIVEGTARSMGVTTD